MYSNKLVAAIKVDGKVLRENRVDGKDIIYLPFGSDYEIYLKNMNVQRAVVSIEIDGEDVCSNRRLVIDGNSSSTLRGKLGADNSVSNAFRFIRRSEKIEAHRGIGAEDGLIRIQWQFEQQLPSQPIIRNPIKSNPWEPYPRDYIWCDTNSPSLSNDPSCQSVFRSCTKSYDAGITVPGKELSQNFETTYTRSLDPTIYVAIFELRGETANKAVATPVLSKKPIQCNVCGSNNSSRYKYCGECSAALI